MLQSRASNNDVRGTLNVLQYDADSNVVVGDRDVVQYSSAANSVVGNKARRPQRAILRGQQAPLRSHAALLTGACHPAELHSVQQHNECCFREVRCCACAPCRHRVLANHADGSRNLVKASSNNSVIGDRNYLQYTASDNQVRSLAAAWGCVDRWQRTRRRSHTLQHLGGVNTRLSAIRWARYNR